MIKPVKSIILTPNHFDLGLFLPLAFGSQQTPLCKLLYLCIPILSKERIDLHKQDRQNLFVSSVLKKYKIIVTTDWISEFF